MEPMNNRRGTNIDLVGCEMGHKIEAGCRIQEKLREGYGMKISWQDRDALVLIGGMRDRFKIDSGMWYLNSK